jgi:amino-acid N-acetyltransferase
MKKSDAFDIGHAGFDDAAAIFALIKDHPAELVPRALSDIVQNIDRFIVGRAGGAVVGTVSWQILPEIGVAKDPSIEIKSLAVADPYRRRGLARLLVERAIESVKPLNATRLVVLTFSPEFFRKLGFSEVRKEELMHKLYAGCVNCTRYDSPFTCPEVAMSLDCRDEG